MDSIPSIITDHDVPHALSKVGLSREIVLDIAEAAAAGRNEALAVDAASAPGWLSYHYGLRALRLNLLPQGWRISRLGNVEATTHDDRGIQLLFQNVDSACNPWRTPRAISRKGSGSRQLVAAGQGELFGTPVSYLGKTPTVWVVCVASTESSLQVEVSRPTTFEGDQFEDFSQRILVADEAFEPTPSRRSSSDGDLEEPDVPVFKK